jgi:hypothetical protein
MGGILRSISKMFSEVQNQPVFKKTVATMVNVIRA